MVADKPVVENLVKVLSGGFVLRILGSAQEGMCFYGMDGERGGVCGAL